MREFLRGFADRGGTVLLSSHLLSEIAHSAEDAIIIDHGRLVISGPVADLAPASQGSSSPRPTSLRSATPSPGPAPTCSPKAATP